VLDAFNIWNNDLREQSTKPRLFAIEVLAVSSMFCVLLLYVWFGLTERLTHPDRNILTYYVELLRSIAFLYPLTLLFAFLSVVVLNGRNKEQDVIQLFATSYVDRGRLTIEHLRLLHASALCLLMFAHLKHLIPQINTAIFDAQLLAFDQLVLGEALLPGLFSSENIVHLTEPMEMIYQGFYPYLSIVLCFFVVLPNRPLAREFCAFYGLLWLLGVGVVYTYPSLGPCFFVPEVFQNLPANSIQAMQQALWEAHTVLKEDPLNPHLVFAISGLPSLHLALALGGSYYLSKVHWGLGAVSWLFAFLTFISTLFFGWHYILDDVASVLLVVVCIVLARKLSPIFSKITEASESHRG
jgi:membrane-associated phospholipid phosphatase